MYRILCFIIQSDFKTSLLAVLESVYSNMDTQCHRKGEEEEIAVTRLHVKVLAVCACMNTDTDPGAPLSFLSATLQFSNSFTAHHYS